MTGRPVLRCGERRTIVGCWPQSSAAASRSHNSWYVATGTCMFIAELLPMRLWMPTTLPSMSNKGPPESPPTSMQSVCKTLRRLVKTRPNRTTGRRSFSYPPGWPVANTQAPRCSFFESPISRYGHSRGSPSTSCEFNLINPASARAERAQRFTHEGAAVRHRDPTRTVGSLADVSGRQHISVLADQHAASLRTADLNAHGAATHQFGQLHLMFLHRLQFVDRLGQGAGVDLLQPIGQLQRPWADPIRPGPRGSLPGENKLAQSAKTVSTSFRSPRRRVSRTRSGGPFSMAWPASGVW